MMRVIPKKIMLEERKKQQDPALPLAGEEQLTKPLVSVIMPVYNSENCLMNSLYSILDQTYDNLELICIDDGSTDSSAQILDIVKKNCKKKVMKVITQENAGPAAARNKGLECAEGDYIAFVDSDDFIEPNTYEVLVRAALKYSVDIVVCGGETFPGNVQTPDWIRTKLSPNQKLYTGDDAGRIALLREESAKPFIWLHFIKRELLETPSKLRFNENFELGEDQILIFSYFPRAKSVCFIKDKLYHYRISDTDSIMHKYYNKKNQKFSIHLALVKEILKNWRASVLPDSTGEFMAYIVNFLYYDLMSFPLFMRIKYARELVAMVTEYGWNLRVCREEQYQHALTIIRLAESNEVDITQEIDDLERAANSANAEIQAILSSKAYKLGKLLTPRSKRIDEELLKEKQENIF